MKGEIVQSSKQKLLGMTLEQLEGVTRDMGMPRFTAKQIAQWLYAKRVQSIDEMTNLSLKHRDTLKMFYEVGAEAPVEAQRSVDGTVKYLFSAGNGLYIESVYIPDKERATLCVSSQVGCKMNCQFCMTGRMGFQSSLSAAQILNQILSLPEFDKLTNVVMMGMGEPLDNLDEVLKALAIMTALIRFGMESETYHTIYCWTSQRSATLSWKKVIVIWLSVYILRYLPSVQR
jgi:23S rRNA (adenine2503-C2)-methyltransferase